MLCPAQYAITDLPGRMVLQAGPEFIEGLTTSGMYCPIRGFYPVILSLSKGLPNPGPRFWTNSKLGHR